jgi:hypothetical protein
MVSMMQIKLIVLCKHSIRDRISNISTGQKATGILNILGNKGATYTGIWIDATPILFINTHLAAHIDRVDYRALDYKQICDSIPDMNSYHTVFWMGDLNYRLVGDRDDIIQNIHDNNLFELYKRDQLIAEIIEGHVFTNYNEGLINFKPTYKFDPDVLPRIEYSSKKYRNPSWCDRILWRSFPSEKIYQLDYNACHDIVSSDHSPVFSTFFIHPAQFISPGDKVSTIIISNINLKRSRGTNVGGMADPYIKFTSDLMKQNYVKTSVKKNTLAACWKAPTKFTSIKYRSILDCLQRYIYITVKDHDHLSTNDLIGDGVIPYADGDHTTILIKHGVAVGEMSCTVDIA